MKKFYDWLANVQENLPRNVSNGGMVLFRGQSVNKPLLPVLFRENFIAKKGQERNAFYFFLSRVGHSLRPMNSWDLLCQMRHYGVPTRLLDWSGSLDVALFFALRNITSDQDVFLWCLNANGLHLKEAMMGNAALPVLAPFDYQEFIDGKTTPTNPRNAFVLQPLYFEERLSRQHSYFTVHMNEQRLEELHTSDLKQFLLPANLNEMARTHLMNNDINEHFVFGDLDSLGKSVVEGYFED